MGTYDTPIRYGTFYTRLHETIHIVQVIWSSFQIGNRFGINANVIENNSKITIDPKISKDTTAPKKKKNKETRPKILRNLLGGSINHAGWCVFYQVGSRVTPNPNQLCNLLAPSLYLFHRTNFCS